jgi:hypothetical protein
MVNMFGTRHYNNLDKEDRKCFNIKLSHFNCTVSDPQSYRTGTTGW